MNKWVLAAGNFVSDFDTFCITNKLHLIKQLPDLTEQNIVLKIPLMVSSKGIHVVVCFVLKLKSVFYRQFGMK